MAKNPPYGTVIPNECEEYAFPVKSGLLAFHFPLSTILIGDHDMSIIYYLILGLAAGCASGLIGIGGGIIMIPVLVFAFKFTQKCAQGTTLAVMVLPIGLLAAWTCSKQGYVDVKAAGLICLGLLHWGIPGRKIRHGTIQHRAPEDIRRRAPRSRRPHGLL